MYPKELKYSKDHEWIRVEGNKGVIGITHYAQHQLGDIVFVELPEVGDEFAVNDSFGVVESVKSVSDLYIPVSGVVTKINEDLIDSPELINEDPYGNGWIVEVELTDSSELDQLLDAGAYEASLD